MTQLLRPAIETSDRRTAVSSALASFRMEGLEPDADTAAILAPPPMSGWLRLLGTVRLGSRRLCCSIGDESGRRRRSQNLVPLSGAVLSFHAR